jgi:Ca-activated chloride channel family protein
MNFAALAVLPLGALLVTLSLWEAQQRAGNAERDLGKIGELELLRRTSRLPSRSSQRRRMLLRSAAGAFALLALARPQLGEQPGALVRTGRDVLVALDLSRSMKATDVGETRLGLAKRLALGLTAAGSGDRVGLIIFGGAAFLRLPLTTDRATLQLFLDAASPADLDDPATNLASALRTAAVTFEHDANTQGHRAVLLLSDGERTVGPLDEVVTRFRKANIPVFAVGIGTLGGARVPSDSGAAEGPWHLDDIGRPVVSHLVETDLQRIGQSTGGGYARFDREDEMRSLRSALAALPARALTVRPKVERAERYQWPLGLAIALLVLDLVIGAAPTITRKTRVAAAAIVLITLAMPGCGRSDRARAEALYDDGRYQEASDAFSALAQRDPEPALSYNAGNAQYRIRRYEDAEKTYRRALDRLPAWRQRVYFNLGNAYVRAAEETEDKSGPLRHAVEAYQEALRLDPGDQDAKWNLELALRRLGDEEESGGSRGRGGRAEYGRGQMREDGYEGRREAAVGAMAGGGSGDTEGESAEELDEPSARRLLEAVERQQLSSHQGRPSTKGAGGEKDW